MKNTKKPSSAAIVSRHEKCEELLIRLCDYIYRQKNNGDYYSDGDIYLDKYAKEINRLVANG